MSVAQLSSVAKSLGSHQILRNISLDIGEGRVFALLGPNGAGKTTTMRVLTGIFAPDSGSVSLLGQTVHANSPHEERKLSELRRRIGVQYDGNLYANLTVRENLQYWADLYAMGRGAAANRIRELGEILDFGGYLDTPARNLSKGNTQKVLISRAMLHNPDLLILDEPTSGLDPIAVKRLTDCLSATVREHGTSVILCTHRLEGLDELADDAAIIDRGTIVLSGSVETLVSRRYPGEETLIEAAPVTKVMSCAQRLGVTESMQTVAHPSSELEKEQEWIRFRICVHSGHELSALLKELLVSGCDVREVMPVTRTIKDVYFDVMGGGFDAPIAGHPCPLGNAKGLAEGAQL